MGVSRACTAGALALSCFAILSAQITSPATSGQINREHIGRAVEERLRDFERALAQPGVNERMRFARRVLDEPASVKPRLLSMIDRDARRIQIS
jgi:hypothetical protein